MVAHAALTGAELHEPKGVATATAKTLYVANGSGSGSWTTLDYASLPDGTVINFAYAQSQGAGSTLATVIPSDNTKPQNTEGTQILSASITPKLSSSVLKITVSVTASEIGNTLGNLTYALFKDSDADAIAVGQIGAFGTTYQNNSSFVFLVSSGSTSARTYKVRAGGEIAGNWALNKTYQDNTYGDLLVSSITIEEIKA